MQFNFDIVLDRRFFGSRKWSKYPPEIIPMWIADMDFPTAPVIVEALHRRVDHPVFGYGVVTNSTNAAVVDYCARRYGWAIEASWIVWLPGLVTGLNVSAATLSSPGDSIVIHTPVYPPFMSAPRNQGRETIEVPLTVAEDGRYQIDFPAFERALTPRTTQVFLCNPHNPVSRVFSRIELTQLAEFCLHHNLIVTSDEIHCDLILEKIPHVPFASLATEVAARTITLMAPSKTYNIPGLCCSFAIIPDLKLRNTYRAGFTGLVPEVNVLGYPVCEAAFRDGEPWRQALVSYLRANRDFIASFLAKHLPETKMTPCEATYLAWLDVSAYSLENPGQFFEQHGVGLVDGGQYSATPGHFVRLNFGCPRRLLEEALQRMTRALAGR